jgi:ElaA protein
MTWESKTWSEMSADDVFEVMKLRTDVFFLEQRITEEELDDADRFPTTRHIWATDGLGRAVAYVRVVRRPDPPDEDQGIGLSIGRLVVDPSHRGQGFGHELMRRALEECGGDSVILHAQAWVEGLYAAHGFSTVGEPFDEAGIVHLRMIRPGEAHQQGVQSV